MTPRIPTPAQAPLARFIAQQTLKDSMSASKDLERHVSEREHENAIAMKLNTN